MSAHTSVNSIEYIQCTIPRFLNPHAHDSSTASPYYRKRMAEGVVCVDENNDNFLDSSK
jgi:hypothetical protein